MTVVIAIRPLETWGAGTIAAAILIGALLVGFVAWVILVVLRR
jgi:hypothetical protein